MKKSPKTPKAETVLPTILNYDWLTLAETKERLQASQSTIERRVGASAIRTKLEPRPGRKPEKLYSREDVERFRKEDEAGNSRSPSPVVPKKPASAELTLAGPTLSGIGELMTQWGARVPLREKLWLSIEEAAALSGLGAGYLKGLMETEKVIAIKGGPNGSWIIRRASLEAFEG